MSLTTIKGKAGLLASVLLVSAALLTVALANQARTQAVPAVTIDLWAKQGTATMPGGTNVAIWGYALQQGGPPTLPGPKLEVSQDQEVTVVLHNDLGMDTSLVFPGMEGVQAGTDGAGNTTYTFLAEKPGTYLYESGTQMERQIQMGLYGALVVKPGAQNQAYDDPSTAYDREAVMVLSEVDRDFHQNPNTFEPSSYAPEYFLINGKAYPDAPDIEATAGQKVLFRYLNAGYQDHTLQLLGMDQRVVAADANLLPAARGTYTQTVAPGETYDLIGTVPQLATSGTRFPLYSREMHVKDGGMTTFVKVVDPAP